MLAKALRVVVVNIAVLLVLAAGAELVFGTWFSADPLDRLNLPRDLRVTVDATGLYPGGGPFPYARDHWGLRGDGVDPAQIIILTLGGSTTNQMYLPEAQTWQKVLEHGFRDEGRAVTVANAGIDGQTTLGHVRAFEAWFPHVPGLKPRFVLIYVGINDVHITWTAIDKFEHTSLAKRIRANSALYRAGNTLAGAVAARRARLVHQAVDWDKAEWTDRPNMPGWVSDHPASAIDAYKGRLKRMAELAHAMGAVPVFVTQPRGDYRVVDGKGLGIATPDGLNGIDQHRLLSAFNQATREVCRDDGLVCLDLARELTFERADFYDYVHTTPSGAAKIGRWLHGKLAGLV